MNIGSRTGVQEESSLSFRELALRSESAGAVSVALNGWSFLKVCEVCPGYTPEKSPFPNLMLGLSVPP